MKTVRSIRTVSLLTYGTFCKDNRYFRSVVPCIVNFHSSATTRGHSYKAPPPGLLPRRSPPEPVSLLNNLETDLTSSYGSLKPQDLADHSVSGATNFES